MNRGMMSICGGTINPAIITQNTTVRPRKGTRERPKAARLVSNKTAAVMIEEVRALFQYQRNRPPAVRTCQKDSRVKLEGPPSGIQVIGTVVVWFSGLSAVTT